MSFPDGLFDQMQVFCACVFSYLFWAILARAAVIGRLFWDTAVVQMNALAEENVIREPETVVALQALEKIFINQLVGCRG